jgi:hypothetical protein
MHAIAERFDPVVRTADRQCRPELAMNCKDKAKAGRCGSRWRARLIKLSIACVFMIILISLVFLPLVALAVILPRIIDSIGASLLESISVFLASLAWAIRLAAYSVWLLLIGDYARLLTLLPELINLLRSASLL